MTVVFSETDNNVCVLCLLYFFEKKVLRTKSGYLAYIDFGLVSEVPTFVRESLVCALVHLIHGEYSMLAECLAGLELMRSDDIQMELPVLSEALREAFEPMVATSPNVAVSTNSNGADLDASASPTGVRRFRDFTLVGVATKLLMLGTRFPLVFRDYFLNNLRCLGMLEGLALNADPNFSVLGVVYPFVVKKMLMGRSERYRHALESVVLDSYGRMRWRRIDQLLYDVEATAATSKIGLGYNLFKEASTEMELRGDNIGSNNRNSSRVTNERKGIEEESKESARTVVRFIMSDAGRFLRRYIIQQYLLNREIEWRRRIDKVFGVNDKDEFVIPLVNVTSPVWRDAAMRWLALQATARELTDDEARIRTREFFRWTPLLKKMVVLMRLIPGAIVPMAKTVIAIFGYAIARWWYVTFRQRRFVEKRVELETENTLSEDTEDSEDSESVAVETSTRDAEEEWLPMESSFARKTRKAQLVSRQVTTVSSYKRPVVASRQ